MENNIKEPTLEEYGLDASSYENYRNQKIELEKSFNEYRYSLKNTLNSLNNTSFLDVIAGLFYIFGFYAIIILAASFFKEYNFNYLIILVIICFIFWFVDKKQKEKSLIIKEKETEIDNKIEIKEKETNEKIQVLKNKIYPFEKASVNFYTDYLNQFFNNNLFKKHSGSEIFEQSLAEFSSMINEADEINKKLQISSINTYSHKSYLEGRKINHKYQINKKFNTYNDIKIKSDNKSVTKEKVQAQTQTTDISKKIAEEIFQKAQTPIVNPISNSVKTSNIINDDVKPIQTNKDNTTPEIENKDSKGFWASIMDDVKSEIDKSNSLSVNANKEKENIIDTTSPENKYRAPRKIDWDSVNKNKKITGLKGEEIVLEMEKSYLDSIGRQDLSEKVKHVSKEIGDGLGYDILSYFADEQEKYIEVKSTNKSSNNSFYLSQNELEFMKRNKNNSVIYRIFNINESEETPTLRVHRADDILGYKQITPVQYLVKME